MARDRVERIFADFAQRIFAMGVFPAPVSSCVAERAEFLAYHLVPDIAWGPFRRAIAVLAVSYLPKHAKGVQYLL